MSEPEISEEGERLYYTAVDKRDKGDADGYDAAREKLFAHIGALESENDRLRAEQEWRPIDTAPKDGTHVLVYIETRCGAWQETVFWDGAEDGWWSVRMGDYIEYPTTHWLPLPPPPKSEPRAAESAKEC